MVAKVKEAVEVVVVGAGDVGKLEAVLGANMITANKIDATAINVTTLKGDDVMGAGYAVNAEPLKVEDAVTTINSDKIADGSTTTNTITSGALPEPDSLTKSERAEFAIFALQERVDQLGSYAQMFLAESIAELKKYM